ncbi:MAG TPA: hypothetical protein VNH43_08875 [Vicinamibacteria bacterium]|nr:hypothetical protein [Vicinamibacteria bacterium]
MGLCTPARLRCILSAAVAGAATLAASSIAAERPWIEIKTPHFVVVANTSEGTARDVGWQFEQVRYVFERLWPWARRERGRPFYVIAVRGESDMRALAPEFWEKGHDGTVGVAVSGPDKDYVALQSGVALPDNLRTNPYFYAYWGYANRALQAAFPGALPLWYARGLSDLFGNTVVRGKDVELGRMLMHHVEQLGRSSRIPLPELLAVDRTSKYYTDESRRATFDAESWMFVHYLVFGDKGAHQAQLNRFSEMLRQGRAQDVAFREAFGDPAVVANGLLDYMSQQLKGYAVVKADLNVKAAGFEVRPVSPAAAAALRGAFHVAMSRPREARALIEEARRAEPASAPAAEAEALLLDNEEKRDEAQAAYARAADGGSENFYVYYRLASLMQRPDASKETLTQITKRLEQAVKLNPDHAWSQASLARALGMQQQWEPAIRAARLAVSLEPSVAAHRLALVHALWNGSHEADALQELQAARNVATNDADRKAVQEWDTFMSSRPK